MIEKTEAIRRFSMALGAFGPVAGSRAQQLVAFIEAMGLYIEFVGGKHLEEEVYTAACLLNEERHKNDPEWQAKLAEVREQMRSITMAGVTYVPKEFPG